MIYLTPITFNGKQPNTPRVVVANRDDNNSQALPIRLPVLNASQVVTLHWVDSDANGQDIPLEASSVSGEYMWLVSETDTRRKADLSVWLEIAVGDDTLWVSDPFIASVGQRLSHNNVIAQKYPDKLQQLMDDVKDLQENKAVGTVTSVNGVPPDENGNVQIETVSQEKIGEAVEEYLTQNPVEVTETDPTVPAWAKATEKPSYTAAEVGALSGTSVYYWLSSDPGSNDLFEILLSYKCGIITNGRGYAPTDMVFPAFVIVGAVSYGNVDFTVYDDAGQTWRGTASLSSETVSSIKRVYPSPEDIGAIPTPTTAEPGQMLVVSEVDDTGAPTAWGTADVPEGGGGIEVTGATVGQTVKIAAVDSSGVPTAWEPVDLPKVEEWVELANVTLEEESWPIVDIGDYAVNFKKLRFFIVLESMTPTKVIFALAIPEDTTGMAYNVCEISNFGNESGISKAFIEFEPLIEEGFCRLSYTWATPPTINTKTNNFSYQYNSYDYVRLETARYFRPNMQLPAGTSIVIKGVRA